MCQLFGINSAKPISPHFSLRGFFRRGGGTDHHADGWGLAYYDNSGSVLHVRDTPAHLCKDANAVLQRPFRANTTIAHVRKATEGKVCLENSHPFVRKLWGKDWVFAHNGDLKTFYPDLPPEFQPIGETDSERAFCYLLSQLSAYFNGRAPSLSALLEKLQPLSSEIAEHGTFNFLLSDGDVLFAHASTQLFWAERRAPFGPVELLDEENHRIDFGTLNDSEDSIIVLATRPLTRGEPWYPMARGELKAFVSGREYLTARPAARTAPASTPPIGRKLSDWCNGWHLGAAHIIC